jgi:hypothetical protein
VPISYTFTDEPKAVIFELSIPISVEDFVIGYESFVKHEKFKPNMPVIWDISPLDLKQIPIKDIRQLPVQLKKFMANRGDDYKAALVTTRSMDFQLMRIYTTILRLIGSNFRMRLFKSLADANDWIAK